MEKLKVKHDHTLTDIIKVAIFALFLILPILVFLPNCLYYGFNEHATNTETTTINYKYESNEVNTFDDLVVGNIYHFNCINTDLNTMLSYDEVDMSFVMNFINIEQYDFSNYDFSLDETLPQSYQNNGYISLTINLRYDATDLDFYLTTNEGNDYFDRLYTDSFDNFNFTLVGDFIYGGSEYVYGISGNFISETDYNVIESVSVNTDDTNTDKVATAWGRMWETPMLSWTDTNTFKFTINAFVTVFGITQESYLANYLTYILVVTCIYLIFDIVLTLTTKLTHLINEK